VYSKSKEGIKLAKRGIRDFYFDLVDAALEKA
jgi:hypothetical protein